MYKRSLALCGLQGFLCHKINQTKPNLRTFWGFQKTSPFHWNLTKSTFSSGQIESRSIEKNKPCPKTYVQDKTNLTFLGIKWPTEFDMSLNKTQTLFPTLITIILSVPTNLIKWNSVTYTHSHSLSLSLNSPKNCLARQPLQVSELFTM